MSNIYFLVEGKRAEMHLYPSWLTVLLPQYSRVQRFHEANERHYFMFSGKGYPSMLDTHLPNALRDANESGKFKHFVICLDADDDTVQARLTSVDQSIRERNLSFNHGEISIIVQNRCIETWLLGNATLLPPILSDTQLLEFLSFYNVAQDDPELMGKPPSFKTSVSDYHYSYLKVLLRENGIIYSKYRQRDTAKPAYLQALVHRTRHKPNHLSSFQTFLDFCRELGSPI